MNNQLAYSSKFSFHMNPPVSLGKVFFGIYGEKYRVYRVTHWPGFAEPKEVGVCIKVTRNWLKSHVGGAPLFP